MGRLIEIVGRRWLLRWVARKELVNGSSVDGECDPPTEPAKEIRVYNRLSGRRRLEVLIHELLHAADWDKSEEWVTGTAHDIARVLWSEGYRPDEDVSRVLLRSPSATRP